MYFNPSKHGNTYIGNQTHILYSQHNPNLSIEHNVRVSSCAQNVPLPSEESGIYSLHDITAVRAAVPPLLVSHTRVLAAATHQQPSAAVSVATRRVSEMI